MNSLRFYGKKPYTIIVIHGGPGAAGEMKPVAESLAPYCGVIEPFQTKRTVSGQIREIKSHIEDHCSPPVIVIGYSWGAWLGIFTAAGFPALVQKLILVGCPPLEAGYTDAIETARMARLTDEEQNGIRRLADTLADETTTKSEVKRLERLLLKTDAYDPVPDAAEPVRFRGDIFRGVWEEAAGMRENGELLTYARQVVCPVVAIHGDYDPHPALGVKRPLSGIIGNFRFHLLTRCGHTPWIERHARAMFFTLLKKELQTG
ncbi:MAG: alpha/beta hydrolase [Spirochaetales bacterium]|nr:alpha/beta hydrolase [Spirochaetales bacterium]